LHVRRPFNVCGYRAWRRQDAFELSMGCAVDSSLLFREFRLRDGGDGFAIRQRANGCERLVLQSRANGAMMGCDGIAGGRGEEAAKCKRKDAGSGRGRSGGASCADTVSKHAVRDARPKTRLVLKHHLARGEVESVHPAVCRLPKQSC
jgi:hypothetical protein